MAAAHSEPMPPPRTSRTYDLLETVAKQLADVGIMLDPIGLGT
jgi:hypothetical protein